MKFLKILGILLLCMLLVAAGTGLYLQYFIKFKPAPSLTIERTPERIERGKYLANSVTVCMDCHSTRDWSIYSGPMLPTGIGGGGEIFNHQMGFPGIFYAPNITPYGVSSWTDGELFRAIASGVNKDDKALFPIMASHRFGKMSAEDIMSIIAYIRTLEPVEKKHPARELDFPVNLLVNTMPLEAHLGNIPNKLDSIAYGGYIINAAGCVDCHSQVNKGAIILGTEYGGGMEFVQPAGIVRAPNITFDRETGIGAWDLHTFIERFKVYQDSASRQKLAPTELNTPMPWTMYSNMTDGDLASIYIYLKSLKPIVHAVQKFELKQQ